MTQTIYIDILICVNLIINYFILSLSIKHAKCSVSTAKIMLGAFIGALLSLVILLPPLPLALSLIVKTAIGVITVFTACGKRPVKIFLRICATFFGVTLALCGTVFMLYTLIMPEVFYIRNGTVYASISPVLLIVITAICYGILWAVNRFAGRSSPQATYCKVGLKYKGKPYELFAKIDTGNSLTEPFSQSPVIVVNAGALGEDSNLYSISNIANNAAAFRMVPFNSVGGNGVLPAFKAQELTINKKPVHSDAYIALCDNKIRISGVDALVNSQLTEDILQ